MTPYYDQNGIQIWHGDCREILPSLSYDLVLSDPPYGISYNRGDGGEHTQHKHKYHPGRSVESVAGDSAPFSPPAVEGPAIWWGANCYASTLPDDARWLCWDKVTRNGLNLRIAECELAWTNCVARPRVFRFMWSGAFRDDERGENYHPTQKPVALMRWCIGLARPVPDIVCDPFMGSGTTLVAAKLEGCRAIGIEIEERYCEIAAKRLAQGVLPFGAEPEICCQDYANCIKPCVPRGRWQAAPPCEHNWVDATNAVIESGEFCIKSNAVRPAPPAQAACEVCDEGERRPCEARDICELAWGLIANAYGGDWDKAGKDWREAAVRWRERWHAYLDRTTPDSADQPDCAGEDHSAAVTEHECDVEPDGFCGTCFKPTPVRGPDA